MKNVAMTRKRIPCRTWTDRVPRHPHFHFSVTDEAGDVYELQLHAGDLVWWLDSVAVEG